MVEERTDRRQSILEPDDPRVKTAFPQLDARQIAALEPFGKHAHYKSGDKVWSAGEKEICMFLVLEGEIEVVDGRTGSSLARHVQGNFSGDIDVISGRPSLVSAIATEDLHVLKVAGDCVRSIVAESPEIGEIILRAFLVRRSLMQELGKVGPLVVGSRFSADTMRVREFLSRNRFPFVWEDLEASPETIRMLQEFDVSEDQTPVVILPNGDLLRTPSNRDLAVALGLSRPIESKIYDLVVVGAGPAGLAAAVYGATEGLSTLIIDSDGPGGQAGTSSRIENYMGFPAGLSGQDLADRGVAQAERFGAQMVVPGNALNIKCNEIGGHELDVEGIGSIDSKCVILAPGASYRRLDIEGIDHFDGQGIYYAATNVERVVCGDNALAVVGGGNSRARRQSSCRRPPGTCF